MGIAFGLNIELVPIPAFMLYAHSAESHIASNNKYNKMLVGIDARLNQIYLAGIDLETKDYFNANSY